MRLLLSSVGPMRVGRTQKLRHSAIAADALNFLFSSFPVIAPASHEECITRGCEGGVTLGARQCFLDEELQNWLDDALKQLPPTHQAVLLLVKRDGLSYEEAAVTAGLSVHTIEKYLVEARARLRVIMKDL